MEHIKIDDLFILFKDTLDKCGLNLLNMSDDDIEFYIYEEFDIGVHSFLHQDSLEALLHAGFINTEAKIKCELLRELFIKLQTSNDWSIEYFRTSSKWAEIMTLSDEIKKMI